jgi:hypothetical protein
MNKEEMNAILHRIAMLEHRIALLEAARTSYGPVVAPSTSPLPFDPGWPYTVTSVADGRNAQ